MITTIMFDLDGTLLPFEQEDFVKLYFGELCKKLAPLGYEPKKTVDSIWSGTKAMIKNDGSRANSDAFWEVFNEINKGLPDAKSYCDAFYTEEFDRARACLKYQANRKPLIDRLFKADKRLILATNPLFPIEGVLTRLGWVGLTGDEFEFITHYENCSYCKPNPDYYRELLQNIGAKPAECLMIGNSVVEDCAPAKALGMDTYLVTDFLENPDNADISDFKHSSFDELEDYLDIVL